MRTIIKSTLLLGFLCFNFSSYSQDDLMDMLEEEDADEIVYTTATFKAMRIANGHSVETRKKGDLDFLISHRFGKINSGSYELFGLDESNIRLAMEYGLLDNINIGVGRSSFEKTYDGFIKYKMISQSSGSKISPVTITAFTSIAIKTLRFDTTEVNHNIGDSRTHYYSSRLAFTNQLLIARKFGSDFSLQISPTMIHRNLVFTLEDPNDIYAVGLGGRYRFTSSFSINGEYYYQVNRNISELYHNSASLALELETGGHVFQLSFSNSRAMIEKGFVSETTGDISNGDIHFGFNIFRTF